MFLSLVKKEEPIIKKEAIVEKCVEKFNKLILYYESKYSFSKFAFN